MKIMNHAEREALKRSGRQEDIDYSHWHRFLSGLYDDGVEVNETTVRPTLVEYISWKRAFPGWSVGTLTRTHTAWNLNYAGKQLPMNDFLKKFNKT